MFENLEQKLAELKMYGATKLTSVKNASWRTEVYNSCLNEIGEKNYGENLPGNLGYLDKALILDTLRPALVKFSRDELGKQVNPEDIYNVCRLVRPGQISEGYRGHFDSHLFTLVTPINIPNFGEVQNGGQLHYFPKARRHPKNEVENVFGKAKFKKFNSASGFETLAQKTQRNCENFVDYCPLLFLGNTTFHGNAPVEVSSTQNRMTILTHFFDPSPKYGVGKMLRILRRR